MGLSFEARFLKYFEKLSGEEQYCLMQSLADLRKPDSFEPKVYPQETTKQ